MHPQHEHALKDARLNDFVLVERRNAGNQDTSWSLLFIASSSLNPLDRGPRILIKQLPSPTRRDIFDYQRYGTWMYKIESHGIDAVPLNTILLQAEDVLTVRPSVQKLRELCGVRCFYGGCQEGLVPTGPFTRLEVPYRQSAERTRAAREGRECWTLCPFCLGWELFERHEHLAADWNADRYHRDVIETHRHIINKKREEMGYRWLPPAVDLSTLTYGAQQRAQPATRFPDVGLTGSRLERQQSPELSTHLFGWFKHAQARVLEDGCGICREPFQDGERMADLPCEHFYHERCVRRHFSFLRGSPCCPLCQHAVAL